MKFAELYQETTNMIVTQLEQGVLPWTRPWQEEHIGGILPYNALSSKHYRGVNVLRLWHAQQQAGYTSASWLTYKQATEAGGHVRKGQRGTTIVFTKWREVENEDTGKLEQRPMLRMYHVWNVNQIDDLPADLHPQPIHHEPEWLLDEADRFYDALSIPVEYGGNKACYMVAEDIVKMPHADTFQGSEGFYSVLAHECVHATGHESRLNRPLTGKFGDAKYAFEEVIAELGAAFLCAMLNIEYNSNATASYIDNWIKAMKEDSRLVFRAASHASQAADFLYEDDFYAEQEKEKEVA